MSAVPRTQECGLEGVLAIPGAKWVGAGHEILINPFVMGSGYVLSIIEFDAAKGGVQDDVVVL